MRNSASLLAVLASLAGCAGGGFHPGLSDQPGGFYRVPGLAPVPLTFSAEEGAQGYRLEPGGVGVELELQVALEREEVRIRSVVRNRGRGPVRYDLRRAVVSGADGRPLELAAVEEDPSRRPTSAQRNTEAWRAGVREIARGERNVITRRYRLVDPDAPGVGERLSRLELDDEIAIGDRTEPVKLRFERAR